MESLGQLGGKDKVAAAELDTMFYDEGVGNYLVVFLRYVKSRIPLLLQHFSLNYLYHFQVTDQQTVTARGGILPELHGGRSHWRSSATPRWSPYTRRGTTSASLVRNTAYIMHQRVIIFCVVVKVDSGGGYQCASGAPGPRQRRRGSPPRLL